MDPFLFFALLLTVVWTIIVWCLLLVAVGIYANRKGRSAIDFTVLSFFLSPISGFICAWIASPNKAVMEQNALATGDYKRCNFCFELINSEAKLCKHCKSEQTSRINNNRLEPQV